MNHPSLSLTDVVTKCEYTPIDHISQCMLNSFLDKTKPPIDKKRIYR